MLTLRCGSCAVVLTRRYLFCFLGVSFVFILCHFFRGGLFDSSLQQLTKGIALVCLSLSSFAFLSLCLFCLPLSPFSLLSPFVFFVSFVSFRLFCLFCLLLSSLSLLSPLSSLSPFVFFVSFVSSLSCVSFVSSFFFVSLSLLYPLPDICCCLFVSVSFVFFVSYIYIYIYISSMPFGSYLSPPFLLSLF